ncbi:hypothetical protein CYLTODRAFT_488091 [Cylindrobasidium torrendii FP15055 ss-10]|uniref:Large ribosomal subunit protein mL54 n=1 Tax=Cylindrobasidium torrendii FP15055 ss-10 TaxID=1314674 RepID=A0A0D7BLD3_9AGAR|nr:hypothetical protein CYLTODRAFT_488091 [Cylindrobasidium torrendii FP15055 ss-10]
MFRPCSVALRQTVRQTTRAYSTPAPTPAPSGRPAIAKSSCLPDTVLEGLNYLKDQPPVLAKPDSEYPDWLWNVLTPKVLPDDGPGGKKERRDRRLENKKKIKERNFMSTQ